MMAVTETCDGINAVRDFIWSWRFRTGKLTHDSLVAATVKWTLTKHTRSVPASPYHTFHLCDDCNEELVNVEMIKFVKGEHKMETGTYVEIQVERLGVASAVG